MFLTTQTYVDIASISVVPRTTGGQVRKIIDLVAYVLCIYFLGSTFGRCVNACKIVWKEWDKIAVCGFGYWTVPYGRSFYLQIYYYYPFSAVADPAKLYNDLRWNLSRPQGFEAVMRVRCGQVSLDMIF